MSNQRNSQKVLEAIQDLHNLEQIVTRENLSSSLAMPMSVIDASLAYLVDCGHIVRIQRGVFRPSVAHSPARMISQSELSDGCVLIEIGDDIMIGKIRGAIQNIPNILNVSNIRVFNKTSDKYNPNKPLQQIKNNVTGEINIGVDEVLHCEPDSIYEIKYPEVDIKINIK